MQMLVVWTVEMHLDFKTLDQGTTVICQHT